jgi:hypothetical protein
MSKFIPAALIMAAVLAGCGTAPQMPTAPVPALIGTVTMPATTVTDPAVVNALRTALFKESDPQMPSHIKEDTLKSLTVQQPFANSPDFLTYSGTVETTTQDGTGLYHFQGIWRPKVDQEVRPMLALRPGITGPAEATAAARLAVITSVVTSPDKITLEGIDVSQLHGAGQGESLMYTAIVNRNGGRHLQVGYFAPGHHRQTAGALELPLPTP